MFVETHTIGIVTHIGDFIFLKKTEVPCPLKLEGNRPRLQGCSIFNVTLERMVDVVNLGLHGRRGPIFCRLILRATNISFLDKERRLIVAFDNNVKIP